MIEQEIRTEINRQTVAIIQARMGSHRFPRKTLHPFSGRPAIGHLLDAVLCVYRPARVHVASSTDAANDPVEGFCREMGVRVHRGHEMNVASRFYSILEATPCRYFVRLSGDSPLLDWRTLLDAVSLALESGADVVSTAAERTFPSGMNVEVIGRDLFLEAYPRFTEERHFEHVTAFFYENPGSFRILPLVSPIADAGRYKFSFDTDEDRQRLEGIFRQFKGPHTGYSLAEKCRLYDRGLKPGGAS